jgi:hypothetical protein
MSITKLNSKLFPAGDSLGSAILAGDGKIANPFYSVVEDPYPPMEPVPAHHPQKPKEEQHLSI